MGLSVTSAHAKPQDPPKTHPAFDEYVGERFQMVRSQLEARDIKNKSVLWAMEKVPRHAFVPENYRRFAYADHPLSIGHKQTISQPYIVAYMTQALEVKATDRVLEVGTGSGYQAAVLAEIGAKIYTIEIVAPLGKQAKRICTELGYRNISFRVGDGYGGWPSAAPFDAIMVTAAPNHVPPALVEQLKVGGRLILPVGEKNQKLIVIEKRSGGVFHKRVMDVRFVPMTGEAQDKR